jgi:formylmethanofuran dehydrogenase subunit E
MAVEYEHLETCSECGEKVYAYRMGTCGDGRKVCPECVVTMLLRKGGEER